MKKLFYHVAGALIALALVLGIAYLLHCLIDGDCKVASINPIETVANPGMDTWFFGYITGVSAALNLDEDIMEDAYTYVDSILQIREIATDAERQQFQCAVDSVLGVETTLWYNHKGGCATVENMWNIRK